MKGDVKATVSGNIKMWLELSIPYEASDIKEGLTEEVAFHMAWVRARYLIKWIERSYEEIFLSANLRSRYDISEIKVIDSTTNVDGLDVNLVNMGGSDEDL